MKINWLFVICNMTFFSIGYFIQERRVNKMEKLNDLYKKMAEAKVVEVAKIAIDKEEEDD